MAKENILTAKQKETLDFIESYIRQNGYSPLITEIKDHFKLKSLRSVTQKLDALERKGLINRDRFKHRGITVINDNLLFQKDFIQVPVIASVGCDTGSIYAQEQFGEYLNVDKKLIGSHKDIIAVKAVGNSMIDAGIHNGDYVLIEQTEFAQSGDRVVVIIGDIVVLKRLQKTDGAIILQPEAKGYAPIILNEDFKIFGKFIRTISMGNHQEDDVEFIPVDN